MGRPARTIVSGIYGVQCTATGHVYVGSALDCETRLINHRRSLSRGLHHNKVLQFAWDVFGEDYFDFQILQACPVADLQISEKRWIASEPLVFNILKDGRRPNNTSPEVRKLLSEKAKAQHASGTLGQSARRKYNG